MGRPKRKGWDVVKVADGLVHVVPCRDLIEHEVDDDCICGPTSELVQSTEETDIPDGWLHTHHSLDNREASER